MATEFSLCLNTFQENCGTGTIKDETDWGTSPNPDRNTIALHLLVAYVSSSNEYTYVSVTPNNADATLITEWDFSSPQDSHYNFFLIQTDLYDNSENYVADKIIYYPVDQKFYYSKQGSFSDIAPDDVDGGDYWQIINDFNDLTLSDYTGIETFSYNDIIDCRLKKCTKDFLHKVVKQRINKVPDEELNTEDHNYSRLMLLGARSMNFQNRMSEAEEIIREGDNFCQLNN